MIIYDLELFEDVQPEPSQDPFKRLTHGDNKVILQLWLASKY